MEKKRVLVVEDQKKISRFIELELQHHGYDVDIALDGRTALNMAKEMHPDLVLLDVMLPELNGMEVLRKIREFSQVPVIMLTAKDAMLDKVMGLDAGANDYITKPFALEELLARIRAALRNKIQGLEQKKIWEVLDLVMDTSKHEVIRGNIQIELTKREYDLLEYFIINKGIALTREQLIENVWGFDYMGDTNVVDVYVRYLRSKIDDKFDKKLIHTIRGVGYMLMEDK